MVYSSQKYTTQTVSKELKLIYLHLQPITYM